MTSLIEEIRAELASKQVRAQAGRFARLAATAFVAQLAALGTAHLGGDALAAVAVGAVETAYRQWAPTVPWSAIAAKLHLVAAQQNAPAAPAVSPAPQPPAATE